MDLVNLWWIDLEFCNSENKGLKSVDEEMKPKFPYDEYKRLSMEYVGMWLNERQIDTIDTHLNLVHSDKVFPWSVYDIESHFDSLNNPSDYLVNTQGMHNLDVYYTEQQNTKGRMILHLMRSQYQAMLNKIRARVEDFLIESEQQVLKGNALSKYFESNRIFVETKLCSLNPTFKDYLESLSNHLLNGTQIDFQEALLDIRRVLLLFANVVYPSQSTPVMCSDGKARNLTEDKYLNRITTAIYNRAGEHTPIELLNENLKDLISRLEKINELACKGVHSEISEQETNQCIIQMYILLGDILRILQL